MGRYRVNHHIRVYSIEVMNRERYLMNTFPDKEGRTYIQTIDEYMSIKDTDIIDHHTIIRHTIGYKGMESIPVEDTPKVMEFLKIVYNYNRMKRVERGICPKCGHMLDKEGICWRCLTQSNK